MKKQVIPAAVVLATFNFWVWTLNSFSQCVTNINFNTWSQAGTVANGNWVVENAGTQIHQTINGSPTFFISPFQMMNVKISGNFRTTDTDDDFMGFVFSFLDPIGQSDNHIGWLFDWKQGTQLVSGFTAQSGKALSKMNGIILPADYWQTFWGHQTVLPQFELKQNGFGGPGWITNFNHTFVLELTFTRAKIYIDGVLIFDQQDCFLPGYFGFYNFSQPDCYYSNFQYELYVDFMALSQVCVGDTANFQFLDTTCLGSIVNLNQYQSLTWNWGDGTVDTINNPTVNNVNPSHIYTTPGTYTVALYLQDTQGCTDTAAHTVIVNPNPTPVITGTNVICNGQNATLTASGGGNYSWNTGDTTSVVTVSPTINTGYSVTLTNTNGCTAASQSTVTVFPTPIATAGNNQSVCASNNVILNAGGGSAYSWSPSTGLNNPTSSNPVASPVATTTYTVTVSNVNGCTNTASVTVFVTPSPTANAGIDITITAGDNATLIATGGGTYSWSNGGNGANITVSPAVTTIYCVTVTNADNCSDTDCVTITIQELPCGALYVPNAFAPPNAFTPNGDNQNEQLCVYGNCIEKIEFVIYDRWGEKVFSTTDLGKCWDGTYKGKQLNSAVFVYYMKAMLTTGEKINKKGNISLIR